MANSKIQNLTAITTPLSTDVVPMVNDPAGTPTDRSVTFSNISKALNPSNIPNTPAGGISSTNVQSALNELDTEKASLSGATFTGSISATNLSGTNTGDQTSVSGNAGTATALQNSRTLWGQSFNGTANVTGSLTSVGDITGGASNMTITSGTGNSRTLVFKTTTSGGVATTALTLDNSQNATFTGNITAGTGTFQNGASLKLGQSGFNDGSILFYDSNSSNTVTISNSGTTSTSYTMYLPTTGGTNGYVLSTSGGTTPQLSWIAPSGFSWATTATGTSGTGLTLTVGNSASASTVAQSIVIGNTQSNAVTGLSIDVGTATIGHSGIKILNTLGNAINVTLPTVASSGGVAGINIQFDGSNFNTNSASNNRILNINNADNAGGGYNTGISVVNSSTHFTTGQAYSGAGVHVKQQAAGGTGYSLATISNVNSSTNGLVNYTLDNTQSGATVMQKIDLGTSAQGHTGLLINAFNASSSASVVKIDASTTGTGKGLNFSGAAGNGYSRIYFGSRISDGSSTTNYGINFSQNIVGSGSSTGYGIYMTSIGNVNGDNGAIGYGLYIANLNQQSGISGVNPVLKYFSFNNAQSGVLANMITDSCEYLFSRTNTATTGTVADNFNGFYFKDTSVQNGAGGTLTAAGSVLKLESVSTQTAGTLTHTKDVLNLTQSSSVTTGKLLTGVVGSTERFKVHPMVANSGTNTAYLFDTTTALSGTTKLLSIANAGTEKFAVDNAGAFSCGNTVATAVAIASTHKVTVVIGGTTYYLLASNV